MIPWLGLIIWSFFIRVTGSEREIEFENENYRIEKIEYVVMSGGHYNYYLIEKMGNSPIELIKKEYYWHPDRVYNFIDIFKMDGSLYFSKKDKSGEADTIRISPY